MSGAEKIVLAVFIGALLLWSTSSFTKLNATLVALMGVSVMLITEVLTWKDILDDKGPWDTLMWMGGLVGMASFLNTLGFIPWFAKTVSASLGGIAWVPALTILLLVYMYAHYGFASLTAHVTAMYPAFVAVAVAAGAPRFLGSPLLGVLIQPLRRTDALLYRYRANLFRRRVCGPRYLVETRAFGASVVNMVIWIGVGGIWWKVLGLW